MLAEPILEQSLAEAIETYAQQTGLQIIYVSEIARGLRTKGVPAGLAPAAALARLLDGTGLRFEFLSSRAVQIFAVATVSRPPVDKSLVRRVEQPAVRIDEIVVSASQRRELASQVPVSMDVWTALTLASSGAKDIAAIADLTPGVEFDHYPDVGAGIETNIAIRGVNAKDGSTTAIYVDDIPVPHDRASTFGRAAPVVFDLDRIEVLRGPQGVLMGEGAEGGGVRFIRTQPSLTTSDGFVHAESSLTRRGAPSEEVGAAAGGPVLQDIVGFRFSAWTRRDGGYVDRVNPFNGAMVDANSNWNRANLVRAALVFAPTATLRITPFIDYQSTYLHDSSAFYTYLSDPGRGVLHNGKLLDQWEDDKQRLISVKAAWSVGEGVNLSAVSSHFFRRAHALNDVTNITYRGFPNPLGPEYPLSYADAFSAKLLLHEDTLAQQFLYSSARPHARVAWTTGSDYLRTRYWEDQPISTAALQDDGHLAGTTDIHRVITQLAVYGQVDLSIRNRWTATLGLRVEHESFDSTQIVSDYLVQGLPTFHFQGQATLAAPRFGLSLQASDTSLYYATIAKGYRAGGPNTYGGVGCPIATPTTYRRDYDWSFELGAKNRLLGGRLRTDASAYHIMWHDLQIQIPLPGCWFGVTDNEGAARIDGFDLGAEAVVTDHLKARLLVAYTDSRYSNTVLLGDHIAAGKGDSVGSLPLVTAPWNVTASADYQFTLATGSVARLRLEDVFHSRNPGPFSTDKPIDVSYAPERRPNPSINVLNVRATLSRSRVELAMYINNVLDAQPTLFRRNLVPNDTLFYANTLRPRTVGLSGNYSF